MTLQAILLPVFVQIALTFALLFWMGRARLAAFKAGQLRIGDIALGQPAWPQQPTQIANTFHNQFETPVLFYVAVLIAITIRKADLFFVVASWLYIATRLGHAWIYTHSNHVPSRFRVYLAGVVCLIALWVRLALGLYLQL